MVSDDRQGRAYGLTAHRVQGAQNRSNVGGDGAIEEISATATPHRVAAASGRSTVGRRFTMIKPTPTPSTVLYTVIDGISAEDLLATLAKPRLQPMR